MSPTSNLVLLDLLFSESFKQSTIFVLSADIVDAITPYSVLSIRHLLNTSVMDILYYTSPLYGGEVRAGLQKELNRLYAMFASRHPNWKGKISILAHSLGCVIVYDIVTGWMGPENRPPSPESTEISPEGLQFSVSVTNRCIGEKIKLCNLITFFININYSFRRLKIFFALDLRCQSFWLYAPALLPIKLVWYHRISARDFTTFFTGPIQLPTEWNRCWNGATVE